MKPLNQPGAGLLFGIGEVGNTADHDDGFLPLDCDVGQGADFLRIK